MLRSTLCPTSSRMLSMPYLIIVGLLRMQGEALLILQEEMCRCFLLDEAPGGKSIPFE